MISQCSLCDKEFPINSKRIKQSKSGLFFCCKEHKNEALRLAYRAGDIRFKKLIPSHYAHPGKACLNCNKELHTKGSKTKYCSQKCGVLFKTKKLRIDWLADPANGSNAHGALRPVCRTILLEDNQYKCSKCGWSEISANSTIPLEVDHIDGNWKNNSYDNLRVLCPNCHSLTPNWKVYNTGTVQSRYSYYKERGWW